MTENPSLNRAQTSDGSSNGVTESPYPEDRAGDYDPKGVSTGVKKSVEWDMPLDGAQLYSPEAYEWVFGDRDPGVPTKKS